jgi:hypothetical protein
MKYYYAEAQNKSAGPACLEEIQRLIEAGTLKKDPMVVAEGQTEWKRLSVTNTRPPAASTAVASGQNQAAQIAEQIIAASKNALEAFRVLATDPVGGMPRALDKLGSQRARGAGFAFGAGTVLCLVFLIYRVFSRSGLGTPTPFADLLKMLLVSAVPFASLLAVCAAINKLAKGGIAFGHDCFIAGASLLPTAFFALVAAILGLESTDILASLGVFSFCVTVLMLFSAFTRVYKLTERLASISVPAALLVTFWLSKALCTALLNHF